MSVSIYVDPFSKDPNKAWDKYFRTIPKIKFWQKFYKTKRVAKKIDPPVKIDEPIYPDKIRFVCISDTHGTMEELLPSIPKGDVLIHAGDFTNRGNKHEIEAFNDALGKLPHRHKIVIAGNHDLGFDEEEDWTLRDVRVETDGTKEGHKLITNAKYLQDSFVEVYGIKIYGSPWHPLKGWSFYKPRGQPILDKWNLIPDDIDVLITHTPPLGHGDARPYMDTTYILRLGDVDLLNTIEKRVKPKFHVFGHIHHEHGVTTNEETTFINAAICDNMGRVAYEPVLFDLPLKEGYEKL